MIKKILNFLIISIICIVPLIITPWKLDYYYLPKARVIYIISVVIFFLLLFSFKSWFFNCELQDLLLILFLTLVIFSTLSSVSFERSIGGRILRHEGLLMFASYILIFLSSSKYYSFSMYHIYFFILTVTVISLYAIIQYFGYDPIPVDSIRNSWSGFAYSTLGNPNFLGSFLNLALPFTSALYVYTKKNIYFIVSSISFLALLCSRTRSAWVGTSISLIVLVVFFSTEKISLKPLYRLLTCFIIISISLNFINDFETGARFTSIIGDAKIVAEKAPDYKKAGSTRIFIWENSLELIKARPFTGYGPDTFDIPFMQSFRTQVQEYFGDVIVDKAHNEYLQLAVTIGIPGLLSYLLFIFTLFIKAIRSLKKNPLIIILLSGIMGYWAQAFFNISVVSVAPVYWALMGIMVSMSKKGNLRLTGSNISF